MTAIFKVFKRCAIEVVHMLKGKIKLNQITPLFDGRYDMWLQREETLQGIYKDINLYDFDLKAFSEKVYNL